MDDDLKAEELQLTRAAIRLNATVLGLALGIICGALIFLATNWLVIKGGDVVGPHLGLLSQFFFGYSVTLVGSLVGMLYGFGCGFVAGVVIAWVYNWVVLLTRGEDSGR